MVNEVSGMPFGSKEAIKVQKIMEKAKWLISVDHEVNGMVTRLKFDVYHDNVRYVAMVRYTDDNLCKLTIEILKPAEILGQERLVLTPC